MRTANKSDMSSEVVTQYWQRLIYPLLLKVAFANIKPYTLERLLILCVIPLRSVETWSLI